MLLRQFWLGFGVHNNIHNILVADRSLRWKVQEVRQTAFAARIAFAEIIRLRHTKDQR